MTRKTIRLVFAGWLVALSACVGDPDVGSTQQAAMNANAMNANAMNANAMNANAMNANAMNANAMNPDVLAAIEDPGADGDLSRELVRYAVSCAFPSGQSFDFAWTDNDGVEHDESYPGLLGLAPGWQNGPLDAAGQEWVSACLAARVNAFGTTVQISSRGATPALATTLSERMNYSTREAAFYGNLFDGGQVYACYDVLTSTLAQLQARVCGSNGSLTSRLLNGLQVYDCGRITVVGPCINLLNLLAIGSCTVQSYPDRYFFGCFDPFWIPRRSITTFVHGLITW